MRTKGNATYIVKEGSIIKKLDYIQLVLYSPGIIIIDKLKAANAINDNLSGLFDGDPVIVPLPEDAPSEIPRITLSSKDERYKLSIARSRLDFVFKYKEYEEKNPLFIDLFDKFLIIFQYFKENFYTQVTRCAIVTDWIIELQKSTAAEYLLSRYMRSGTPITKPHELQLHYLTKESIAGFNANKWTRIKSARKTSDPEKNMFIIFHMDINTPTEVAYEFEKETVQKFLKQSIKIINETVEKHFKNKEE